MIFGLASMKKIMDNISIFKHMHMYNRELSSELVIIDGEL